MVLDGSRLLALPRELRDEIYSDYLFTSDGYTYDFDTGKLRMADGQPVDLGLMYTCRLIASEMRGLALRVNTVFFSTLYTDELRTRAGRWSWVARAAIQSVAVDDAVAHLSIEKFEQAMQLVGHSFFATRYRRLRAILRTQPRTMEFDGWNPTRGEAPSVYREAERQFMQLALADKEMQDYFQDKFDLKCAHRVPGSVSYLLALASEGPWKIPTEAELDVHAWQVNTVEPLEKEREKAFWEVNRAKPRFSAAAAAIHFLNSIPASVRGHLRKIVIRENRMSVNSPASHVRGLIPFCLENPTLRVERHVDLWRNCFLSSTSSEFPQDPELWLARWEYIEDGMETLCADKITKPVAEWMTEASLPDIPEAITLVLDGGPIPEHTSRIFQEVVHRDAAWQTALDRAFSPEHADPEEVYCKRTRQLYHFEGFPELLRAMCDNEPGSRVRCNFDPGHPWNNDQINEIVQANNGCTTQEWDEKWMRRGAGYRPVPPLPGFHSLKQEYVFSDGWIRRFWEYPAYVNARRIDGFAIL